MTTKDHLRHAEVHTHRPSFFVPSGKAAGSTADYGFLLSVEVSEALESTKPSRVFTTECNDQALV